MQCVSVPYFEEVGLGSLVSKPAGLAPFFTASCSGAEEFAS